LNAAAGVAGKIFRRIHLGHFDSADMYAVSAARNVRRVYAGAAMPPAIQV
jgi:hypothetical protein